VEEAHEESLKMKESGLSGLALPNPTSKVSIEENVFPVSDDFQLSEQI